MRVMYELYWERGIKCFGLLYGHLEKRGEEWKDEGNICQTGKHTWVLSLEG